MHIIILLQVRSKGYFCVNVLLRGARRPALKTSATDLTWRQSPNECGSGFLTNAPFHLVLPLCFQKRRLLSNLKHTHTQLFVALFPKLPSISAQPAATAACYCRRWARASLQGWKIQTLTGHGKSGSLLSYPCNVRSMSYGEQQVLNFTLA